MRPFKASAVPEVTRPKSLEGHPPFSVNGASNCAESSKSSQIKSTHAFVVERGTTDSATGSCTSVIIGTPPYHFTKL